eukprot:363631-Chlamydomonas_euryale.AAC.9
MASGLRAVPSMYTAVGRSLCCYCCYCVDQLDAVDAPPAKSPRKNARAKVLHLHVTCNLQSLHCVLPIMPFAKAAVTSGWQLPTCAYTNFGKSQAACQCWIFAEGVTTTIVCGEIMPPKLSEAGATSASGRKPFAMAMLRQHSAPAEVPAQLQSAPAEVPAKHMLLHNSNFHANGSLGATWALVA